MGCVMIGKCEETERKGSTVQKKIMILGAGVYQVPLIEAAKRMGLYTIAASIPGNYPGFALADRVYEINTVDKEKILEVCKQEQIDGICTTGTDVAVETIGYVCRNMGLPGVSEEAAVRATDKARMKESFESGGVAAARFCRAYSYEEVCRAAEKIGFPVVVKRVDSSGSRGITIVNEKSQLKEAYENAKERSSKPYVLVEEKLNGIEIGVDGMVQGKELVFLAPHEKFVYYTKHASIPAGHGFPYLGSESLQKEIEVQMRRAVKALGLNNCCINADVFVDPMREKAWVIEMGGRTGATCIPELISLYYGFDFYEKILQNALGNRVSFEPQKKGVPCMAKLLMSPIDGVITAIDQKRLDAFRAAGVQIKLDFPVGHAVEAMVNGTTRIGHVVMEAECVEQLDQMIRRVYECIEVDGTSLEELWEK